VDDDELHALLEELETALREDARTALAQTAQDFATAVDNADELVAAAFGVSRIGAMWRRRVGGLVESLRRIARRGAAVTAEDLQEPLPSETDTSEFLDPYLDQVRTQLNAVGDRLSERAVTSLREGIELGETQDELKQRMLAVFSEDGTQLGDSRATRIAMTEATSAFNAGVLAAAQALTGPERPLVKQWQTRRDTKVREAHADANGQIQFLDDPFDVAGVQMQFPGDPTAPIGLLANCRCVLRTSAAPAATASANGRNDVTDDLTAADAVHTGAMIALIPTAEDAQRLTLDGDGAEPTDELHLTLWFLGDAAPWTEDQRNELIGLIRARAGTLGPVHAYAFGVNHWNPASEDPAWVWAIGDDSDASDDAATLHEARNVLAVDALESTHERPDTPFQHSPWVAHATGVYTPETWPLEAMTERLGPITFDRVRIAFGGEHTDIPLSEGARTAAATAARGAGYREGDRVRVKGAPHEEGHKAGVVSEIHPGPAYGITFDGTSEVHHWYVGDELTSDEEPPMEHATAAAEPPAVTWSTPDGTALAFENQQTGDGRVFTPGALHWDGDGPWPLKLGHDAETELAGAIHGMGRDGDRIAAHGVLYPATDAGWEAATLLAQGAPLGVSVDLDDVDYEVLVSEDSVAYKGRLVTASVLPLADGYIVKGQTADEVHASADGVAATSVSRTVTFRIDADGLVAAAGDGAWTEGAVVDEQKSGDLLMRITRARIRGASLVTIPAFAGARIVLNDPGLFADGHTEEAVSAAIKSTTDYDRVLRHVRRSNQPVGAARLAQFLKLPLAAAQRLLAVAASRGEVVRLTRGLYTDKTTSARADHVMMDDMTASLTASASGAVDLPVAPRDANWDGDAAKRRVIEWADGDCARAGRAFAYRDDSIEDCTQPNAWKLGFADIVDGTLTIIPNGAAAALAAVNGARGGVDIPEGETAAVRQRLESVRAHVIEETGGGDDDMQASAWTAFQDLPPMPAEWFEDPTELLLADGAPGVVYDKGRVYGWVARAGEPHAGYAKKITIDGLGKIDTAHFLRQRFALSDGSTVKAGVLAMGTGHHADGAECETSACSWDDSRTVAAIVTVGMNQHGMWYSGASSPFLSEWDRTLFAALQASYHMKRGPNGVWQLRGILAVPVPGHSTPLMASAVIERSQMAITAAATMVEVNEAVAAEEARQAADVKPHDVASVASEAEGLDYDRLAAAIIQAQERREAEKAAEEAELEALLAEANAIFETITASAYPETETITTEEN
jgi:2'-5' RNA ligase